MAQEVFNALLFDTRSIQRYIYSGNKLRTNVGASYIVDRVFFDVLIDGVLREMFPVDMKKFFPKEFLPDKDAWTHELDKATPWKDMQSCCVAYVGGGNALLLFKEADKPVEVVKNFTRRLLVKRPGLKVGAAHGKLRVDGETLNQDDIDDLYSRLKENQNNIFPAVNVPYTGLTLSCEVNGETANFYGKLGEKKFYSQETAVKFKAADDANDNLPKRFKEIFKLRGFVPPIEFEFPSEVEKLGQKTGENYFAIVHVDGNNMGLKFRTCKTLTARRILSREIRRKTEGAFAKLLEKIIVMKNDDGFDKLLKLDENVLPIRPLIIGGDDVTFLCPANMAILFTKTLLEFLDDDTLVDTPEHLTEKISQHMDACAGIAILPTKYPFFRGYKLAEDLCDSAKKSMRKLLLPDLNSREDFSAEEIRGSSWLDFAILHGEQAPTLEQIRAKEYRGAQGDLHFGAYLVRGDGDAPHRLDNLLWCTEQFLHCKRKDPPPDALANNKIKELRGILQHGEFEAEKFLAQLKHQGKSLPKPDDWSHFEKTFWHAGTTPYVDAIELMDFYDEEAARQWQKNQST